jgi:UDP-2-acetamido-2,6-beta-L-arabino-hexul-4-ose reductase
MKILITGGRGFIGRNLNIWLIENGFNDIDLILRSDSDSSKLEKFIKADIIFHLAGENRPQNLIDFKKGNVEFTKKMIDALQLHNLATPIIFASSTQAVKDNEYGKSKLIAEELLLNYSKETKAPVCIYRLTNVFGKWCKPNYNSVVATFCHSIINNNKLKIDSDEANVCLVYIDHVCDHFTQTAKTLLELNAGEALTENYYEVKPQRNITILKLANILKEFHSSRMNGLIPDVGSGFERELWATFLSYYSPLDFSYPITINYDHRGGFAELVRTKSSGQFSFFTASPGITRGGHYHHTKTEKFFVLVGEALFKFKNITTGEKYEITSSGGENKIIETIPGWSHDITNKGESDLVVALWASELFNEDKADTFNHLLT